jgi:hypothetical protein
MSALVKAHTRVRPYNSMPEDFDLVSELTFPFPWRSFVNYLTKTSRHKPGSAAPSGGVRNPLIRG